VSALRRLAPCVVAALLACSGRTAAPATAPFDISVVEEGRRGERALELLARDFYRRIANRRFNSIATYQDPSLREFFRSEQAWSDYYADLVQKLEDGHFEAVRPTRVEVQSIDLVPQPTEGAEATSGPPAEGDEEAKVTVRFVGENSLPLRWWKTSIVREDRWRRIEDRWWIVPGKL